MPVPPAVVCTELYVLFQCSRSASVATFSLLGPLAMKIVSISSSSRCRSRMLVLHLFGTLEMVTRFAILLRAFGATNCFPSEFPSSKKTLVVSILNQFMTCLKTCSLTFVTCSWICLFTCAKCVSKSSIVVTRLALCCVCDHAHFTSCDSALFFDNILEVLRHILVLLFVVLGESLRHHLIVFFFLETQEHVSPTTLSLKSFPGSRCLATVLVLLEFSSILLSNLRFVSKKNILCAS